MPVDAWRKLDPTVTVDELNSAGFYAEGVDAGESVYARIEEVEDDFEEKTNNPQRLAHAGGAPDAYEYPKDVFDKHQGGVKIYLDHRNVLPIDPAKGDTIEFRRTRDTWRDITGETDLWRLNPVKGVMQVFAYHRLDTRRFRQAYDTDPVRLKYRYGALGGNRKRPGETELSSQLSKGSTSVSVDDAERLPRGGFTALVGDEYIRIGSVDRSTDTLTVSDRGRRGTKDSDHSSGETVHYCRMGLRSAIAAKVAVELAAYENYVVQLSETESGLRMNDKLDLWNQEYENALSGYSEARSI